MVARPLLKIKRMWNHAPVQLTLQPGLVHIWRAELQVPTSDLSSYISILSKEERARANRFYFQKDRNQFAVGRSILRQLIGKYAGVDPKGIQFEYSEFGKPSCPQIANLKFNLSNKNGLALIGFTLEAEIGVDLEEIQPNIAVASIAENFFAQKEREAILRLPEDQQVAAFFHCWTCKEAFIKAHGQGLSLALDQFEVEVHPEIPAALKKVNWEPAIADKWDIQAFIPQINFAGAVVLDRVIDQIEYFSW